MDTERLPNLLIAGVEKAGTTSLFTYLGQHPEICPSNLKEIDYFFSSNRGEGALPPLQEYTKHYSHCGSQRYRLEASPSYWYGGPRVVATIKRVLPEPRVLICLRDPVNRFWSAYTYLKSMGRLPPTQTLGGYLSECETLAARPARSGGQPVPTPLSIGLYAYYLQPWLNAFRDDDLLIIFAERLFDDPKQVMEQLFMSLGLETRVVDRLDYEVKNQTIHPRSLVLARAADVARRAAGRRLWRVPALRAAARRLYEGVNRGTPQETFDDESRARVEGFYRDSNLHLAALLRQRGFQELPEWLSPSGLDR